MDTELNRLTAEYQYVRPRLADAQRALQQQCKESLLKNVQQNEAIQRLEEALGAIKQREAGQAISPAPLAPGYNSAL